MPNDERRPEIQSWLHLAVGIFRRSFIMPLFKFAFGWAGHYFSLNWLEAAIWNRSLIWKKRLGRWWEKSHDARRRSSLSGWRKYFGILEWSYLIPKECTALKH